MSYEQNLGRVKGDAGTTYIPKIEERGWRTYISYTSNDGSLVPPELEEKELSSYVYKPLIDSETKEISFTLVKTSSLKEDDANLSFESIKGDTGYSTIGTKIVPEEPDYNSLPDEEKELIDDGKSLIYIIDTNEAYLDTGVFEKYINSNDEPAYKFVYFENKLRFDNYYTINQVYRKDEVYNRNEIDTRIGKIIEQQEAINRMLNNSGPIIIPEDE